MKPTTLQDIAERAGVSRNTVSCALRNHPSIPEKTRERIRRVAQEMGYRPNPLVSALMESRRSRRMPASTANLAFLHNFGRPEAWRIRRYCVEIFAGAEARAAELGFTLSPAWCEPGFSPAALTRTLRNRGVVGVILPPLSSYSVPPALEWDAFAATAIGPSLKSPRLHVVGTLFLNLLPIAVKGLHELGYRRIGVCLSPRSNERFDFAWEGGYAIAKRHFLRSKNALYLWNSDALPAPGFVEWMKEHRIEALIVAGTVGVAQQLSEMGLRVPEDCALVDLLDDSGRVATVHREHEAIGRTAVDVTVNQLLRNERGVPAIRQMIYIDGVFDPRNTVRRFSPGDRFRPRKHPATAVTRSH